MHQKDEGDRRQTHSLDANACKSAKWASGKWCAGKEVEEEEDDETYNAERRVCLCACVWLQLVEFVNYHFPFPSGRKLHEDERTFSVAFFFAAALHHHIYYFFFSVRRAVKHFEINALNNFRGNKKWSSARHCRGTPPTPPTLPHIYTSNIVTFALTLPSLNCLRLHSALCEVYVLIRFCLLSCVWCYSPPQSPGSPSLLISFL